MSAPAEGEVDDRARRGDRVKCLEGLQDDRPLLLVLAGFAERVPEWPLDVNGTWRPHFFSVFPNDGNTDRRHARFFDFSLDQPDGLVADSSGWGEKNHVDCFPAQQRNDLTGRFANQGGNVVPVDMTHEGIVMRSQGADAAFPL